MTDDGQRKPNNMSKAIRRPVQPEWTVLAQLVAERVAAALHAEMIEPLKQRVVELEGLLSAQTLYSQRAFAERVYQAATGEKRSAAGLTWDEFTAFCDSALFEVARLKRIETNRWHPA